MRLIPIMAAALATAGCGSNANNPAAATQRASDITNAQVAASGGIPGANVAIKTDAQGCKDKAKANELIAADKAGDTRKALKLWADGMKDETCRGFAPGLPVKVDHTEGNLACILPADDPKNKTCFFIDNASV